MDKDTSKTLQEAVEQACAIDEGSMLDKFKNLWKKNPIQPDGNDPTLPDSDNKDGQDSEKAVTDLADKLNIELVKGKYPHSGEVALKDPEVIRLMTIFGKEALKGTTGGGSDIESLKKMTLEDPASAINMMLYHVSVKTRPFQRTGLDPKTPISLFKGIDDDRKDNFGNRLKQSLKSKKRKGISDDDIEKVASVILQDLEDQLKANGFVVQEAKKKKRASKRKRKAGREELKPGTVVVGGSGKWLAKDSVGTEKTFHQVKYNNNLAAAKKAAERWAKRKIYKPGTPVPDGIQGLKSPNRYRDDKAIGKRYRTWGQTKTTPQKGTIEIGKALAGKILKSQILGDIENKEERQNAQKEITRIITKLARPWFKKHIAARGQLKNIKLKEQLNLFEHTLSKILFEKHLPINNFTGEELAEFIEQVNKFYPYAQEYLKFDRPTSLNLISDPTNAKDMFGKTAYYNPGNEEITIFVDKRHPKDMLRSFSHELVHHAQNCRGEFDRDFVAGENYIETDEHLKEMEREAYDKGNMCLRTYESYLKKENQK